MKYFLAAIVAGISAGVTGAIVMQHPELTTRTYWTDLATKPPCSAKFREAANSFTSSYGRIGQEYVQQQADSVGCRL